MNTSNGLVIIVDDTEIEYQDNLEYLKRGERKRRGKGDLTVTNSNADVNVAFDI
jgi:type II secretory pathway predicted ATPase ExeA